MLCLQESALQGAEGGQRQGGPTGTAAAGLHQQRALGLPGQGEQRAAQRAATHQAHETSGGTRTDQGLLLPRLTNPRPCWLAKRSGHGLMMM